MSEKFYKLERRGFDLGVVSCAPKKLTHQALDSIMLQQAWQQGEASFLPEMCAVNAYQQEIDAASGLYLAVLSAEQNCDELLDQQPYKARLAQNFESLGSSMNECDDQEIETVLFDAIQNDQVLAEDLWMKASWLSFHEEDASLRFRFSFGVDLHEDVAADHKRQYYASLLTAAVFPESSLITENIFLKQKLAEILGVDKFSFVERIIYFNSPNGGAYLHHDRERGHAGVVYAQLTGETLWLALPKQQLIHEITKFVENCQRQAWPETLDHKARETLLAYASNQQICSEQLESFANETLIQLINETAEFVQQLINHGYSNHLQAGDVLLLPQETEMNCCWHSVFCLGETPGQALSFAIRAEKK